MEEADSLIFQGTFLLPVIAASVERCHLGTENRRRAETTLPPTSNLQFLQHLETLSSFQALPGMAHRMGRGKREDEVGSSMGRLISWRWTPAAQRNKTQQLSVCELPINQSEVCCLLWYETKQVTSLKSTARHNSCRGRRSSNLIHISQMGIFW